MPIPLNTNSAMNPTRYSASDRCCDASSTMDAPAIIATKFQNVTVAPPSRSASAPPTGRISDPSSGPRNVRYAALTGVSNWSANCTCST